MHGSHSGANHSEADEWLGTANYCQAGCPVTLPNGVIKLNYYAWHATIGPDRVGIHLPTNKWGVSAGNESEFYLAVEFSQCFSDQDVSVDQEEAFCWWFVNYGRKQYPLLPVILPYHSELPQGIANDKTDLFSRGSAKGVAFRARLKARLAALGVT